MRLIDADELIKGRVENDPVRIAVICAPTAFDIDKVLEKLEEHKIRIKNRKERDILNTVGKTNAKAAVEEDIEIIKVEKKE